MEDEYCRMVDDLFACELIGCAIETRYDCGFGVVQRILWDYDKLSLIIVDLF